MTPTYYNHQFNFKKKKTMENSRAINYRSHRHFHKCFGYFCMFFVSNLVSGTHVNSCSGLKSLEMQSCFH